MPKQFSDVNSRYGAPMGRREYRGDYDAPYKFRLFRVRLDRGGYDDGGAYWGAGQPLYCAEADAAWDESAGADYPAVRLFLRAGSRAAAKAKIAAEYPNARFYR